ncbi:hypothetical protein E4T56_gene938 [Termitomyces sp. T112]|nr:hypothetical protein E4T56_gene938 [Termitomyces sp. T112]
MDSVDNNLGKMIFIHSAGGCGKTFVCNTLASAVRSNGDVALCVASSGIAALLLEGGRTAHSRFKIPIPALDTSIANIKRGTQLSQLLLQTKVVIWDEVPMQHKNAIDSVDQGKHIKKDCKYCLSGNLEWFTNHLMSIAGPCSIDILNGLQIISNIYQWTL